ncbi:T9SS type A sorting domain-containing protein [Psychroserpens sp.]|uniref:T9SS type A sorting domain-containing protein n=1 Tax=Psychroserpens sp. TaxID=2020870 RepID=UPI003C755F1B
MKKITLLCFALCISSLTWAQCVNSTAYLTPTAINDGSVEQIAACTYSTEYNTISGLVVGDDYSFVATDDGADVFVSITDGSNVSIAFGPSPLTVTGISAATVRLHVTADAACAGGSVCHVTSFQNLTVAASACDAPEDFEATNITDVSTDLVWTAPTLNVVSYDVEVYLTGENEANGDAPVFSSTAVTGETVMATGLSELVDYDAYITTNCDGSTATSPLEGPLAFSTTAACSDVTNVNIDTIRDISADVVFTPGTGNDNFLVEVYASGESASNGDAAVYSNAAVSASPEMVTGLTAETDYDVFVTGSCGSTATSIQGPISFTSAPTPPSNDECDAPIALTVNADLNCAVVTSGTNVDATASSQEDDVSGTPSKDVWFSFTATNDAHTIQLLNKAAVVGTSTDMGMGLYDVTNGCSVLTFVATSDPDTFTAAGLTVGNDYVLRVYGWSTFNGGAQITFDVCVGTPAPAPANDQCDSAISMLVSSDNTCDEGVSGSTQSAFASTTGCTGGRDVWYSFTATADVSHTVAVTETFESASFISTYISVYEGTCGALTQIGTSCFSSAPNTFDAVSGTTYFIAVRSSSTTGYTEFDLCVFPTPNPPANDACVNAISIADGDSIDGDTTFATNIEALTACQDGGGSTGTGCSGGTGFNDFGAGVWYVYAAENNETVTVTTDNSPAGFDTEIQVYTGDCSALVCVGGDDDGGDNGSFSTFCWDSAAAIGDTVNYYIYVDGHTTARGEFTLDLSVAQTLGIDDLENATSFTYFPNPVKNELVLNAQNNIQNVAVLNMLGQQVLSAQPNTVDSTIDMNGLSQGAYFVKVTIGNTIETIRIIKQ